MTINTAVAADHNAPPITAQLARFVAEHPAQGWSDAVEHEAHRTFLNWLGCAIGAFVAKLDVLREQTEGRTLRENLGLPFPTNRHAAARSARHAAE